MRRVTIALVGGILLSTFSAEAQTLTGSLIGVVRDESGAVLPGVTATVTSPAMPGGPVVVSTNAQGEYRFIELRPGIYELKVELPGFKSYVEQDLRITVGGTIERDVVLGVGAVAETITVSGQAPVVDARQTGVANTLPRETLENIPTSRYGIFAYALTIPGVTGSFQRGGATIMGSPGDETSQIQDGLLINSVQTGGGFAYQDLDGNEEINVVALGASAEYQQAQGGIINIVAKAGTNRFRGDGSIYWGPDALSSTPIKRPCNCPEGETGFTWLKYRDRSAHFGGPIRKDRLWFYTGETHVGQTYRNPGQPTPAKEHQLERWEARTTTKVTWKLNRNMTFNQLIYYEWWEYTFPPFPTATEPLEATLWVPGDIRNSASELTWTISPSTLFMGRYGINFTPFSVTGFGPNFTKKDITTIGHYDTFTGVGSGNMTSPTQAFLPRRDQVHAKINHYMSGDRVNQNMRVGYQWARNHDIDEQAWAGGGVFYDFNGAPDLFEVTPPYTAAAEYRAHAIWAEDELTFGQRLTIVPAVRFDRMQAISPETPAIEPNSLKERGFPLFVKFYEFKETGATVPGLGEMFTWTQWSPRLGVNLKLTADGKTILRGTAGRYHRPIFLSDFVGAHPAIPPTTLYGFNAARCPGATVATATPSCYTTILDVTDPIANLAVDRNMNAPYTDQYSIGVDREVANNLGVSVTVVHKESKDQIGWIDTAGVYGTREVTAPNGSTVTVLPLISAPGTQRFLRTNQPKFFTRYNGIILALNRRYANGWMMNLGYALSKTEGLQFPGSLFGRSSPGRDPNDFVNRAGRLGIDQPHSFTASGVYEVPKIAVQVSGHLFLVSGAPYGAQMQVVLPQGRRTIYFDAPGAYRRPSQQWLNFRATKILFRNGPRRLELTAEVRNALQEVSVGSLITQVSTSPNFGKPSSWADPRQLIFLAKVYF